MGYRRREQKNIHLGVRVLQAQVAWLEAPLRWEEGRVTWEGLVPDAGLLWKTQKRLRELRALGRTIDVLQLRLELAKRLLALTESDTVGLLLAEALCENTLPLLPSQRLARQGWDALPELRALAADPLTPHDAQPLIALLQDVCAGERPLPCHPDLTARLLAQDPTFPTDLLAELPVLALTPESLRRSVREGLPISEVVRWLEEARARKALLRHPELRELLKSLSLPSALVACELAEHLLQRERPQPVAETAPSLVRFAPQMLEALGPVLELETSPEWLACVVRCADELWPHPELVIKARLKGKNRDDAIVRKAQAWRQARQAKVVAAFGLFRRCRDAALVAEVLPTGTFHLLDFEVDDPELYAYTWSLLREFSFHYRCELFGAYGSVSAFRADFGDILQVIRSLPETVRSSFFASLIWYAEELPRPQRRKLPQLAPRLRSLAAQLPTPPDEPLGAYWNLSTLLSSLSSLSDPQVLRAIQAIRTCPSYDINRLNIARDLAQGDVTTFGTLLERLFLQELDWVPISAAEKFCKELGRFPKLVPLLTELAREKPRAAIELLSHLGEALRLGLDALEPLQRLVPEQGEIPDAWKAVAAYLPDCPDLIWAATEPLPPGMAKLLTLPERLEREAAYLADRPELAVRYHSLQTRLADPEALRKTIADELAEAVALRARQRRFSALRCVVEEVYRNRLRTILGSRAQTVTMTPDVMNAALLTLDIVQNRRLLIRLLRAYFDGDTGWVLRQRQNVAFLAALTERGTDATAWRGAHGETIHGWHFQLETDPLAVLQMGNYFDTCLSFGGCNAFSTVANACDGNKRVLYVRDTKGRVVARQLLGLSDTGELLGYHLYSTLPADDRPQLTMAVLDYVTRFAQRCGIPLGKEGQVSKVLSEEWYDDGVCDWEALVVQAPPVSPRASSPAPHGSPEQTSAQPAP